MRILFITWDAPDATYLESLFVPIFTGLRARGVGVDILQYRWGSPEDTRKVAEMCHAAGFGYVAASTQRLFGPAGAFVAGLLGRWTVRRAVQHFGSTVLMPRSLLPALATLAAGADRLRPVVFDADGLASDERVEFGGLSATGATYRILRDVEAQMVRRSASVLVRSERAGDILANRAGPPVRRERFHVVTNGRDEDLFAPGDETDRLAMRSELGFAGPVPVIAYAGSVGPQYRFDRFGAFAHAVLARRPDTRLLVLTGAVEEALAALSARGRAVSEAAVVRTVPPQAVPRYLSCADVGAAYRQPSFSMTAVAPIKLSEYLLCGLPVVGTASIGATQAAVAAGVFFDEQQGPEAAADWFVETVLPQRTPMGRRAREVGVANFSVATSVRNYHDAIMAAAPA